MAPFRPSQVRLAVPPLVGTMGNAETEQAAALIVRTCQVHGDKWQAVSWAQVRDVMASNAGPLASVLENPFFKPSFVRLGDGTYGRMKGAPGDSTIELTKRGIESLRRWVIPIESGGCS